MGILRGLRFPIFFDADRKSSEAAAKQIATTIEMAGKQAGDNFYRETTNAFNKIEADLKLRRQNGALSERAFDQQYNAAKKAYNSTLSGIAATTDLTDRQLTKITKSFKAVDVKAIESSTIMQTAWGKATSALAGVLAVGTAIAAGRSLWNAASEAEKPWNDLAGTLADVGIQMDVVRASLTRYSKEFEEHTANDDESFIATFQTLLTISGDYNRSLEAVTVTADLASARHISLDTAAQLVGKAMNGNTTALHKMGIEVKAGADVIQVLRDKLHGMAENELNSVDGKTKHLNALWGDAKEAVGGLLQAMAGSAPMQGFGKALHGVAGYIDEVTEAKKRFNNISMAQAFGYVLRLRFQGKSLDDDMSPEELLNASANSDIADSQVKANAKQAAKDKLDREAAARKEAAAKAAAEEAKAQSARDKEISDLKQAHELGTLRIADIQRIIELTSEYGKMANKPGATLADRTRDAGRVKSLTDIFGGETFGGVGRKYEKHIDNLGVDMHHTGALVAPPMIDDTANKAAASKFKSPWLLALDEVRNQAGTADDIFAQLGDAWANGGLAGIAKWAKGMAKQSLAMAVTSAAHAIYDLARGNPVAAAADARAAAAFGGATALWGGVAGFAGAASGGSTASLSSGGNVGGATAASAQLPQELHVYINPNDPTNPVFIKAAYSASQTGQELYNGMKVTVHPNPNKAA